MGESSNRSLQARRAQRSVGTVGSDVTPRSHGRSTPTVEEAALFAERANGQLLELSVKAGRAAWVQNTFITDDTETLAADASRELSAAMMDLAAEAIRFDGVALPDDVARQIELIKLSVELPVPSGHEAQLELTRLRAALQSAYGKGMYNGMDLLELSRTMAESHDPDELLDAWLGWRTIAPPMREPFARFVSLANEGARDLGYADLGALWRSGYDMPADVFEKDLERLWLQVKPLYDALHAHTRAALARAYGPEAVPLDGLIPAHLLGNMWSQSWENIYPLLEPGRSDSSVDLTRLLREKGVDELEMVRYGERFFTSLGFEPLPASFWDRSMFIKPLDRDVVCHASAWDIDLDQDVRIKMCVEITGEDFITIHHELGHTFYQRAYRGQPVLYREGANDGFHEAIGDVIALSVTPRYLVSAGLLAEEPSTDNDGALLLRKALEKVAFLPFGLLVDKWRWQVFSGETPPAEYTSAWWELVRKYQGVGPPVARSEADFDPGAKFHIPANMPYARYFLAFILQFQIHRAFARQAGHEGPLHRYSVHGDTAAGARLADMLAMGRSRPWPEALFALTGEREIDATALLEYFAPLERWLAEQNRGRHVGWEA